MNIKVVVLERVWLYMTAFQKNIIFGEKICTLEWHLKYYAYDNYLKNISKKILCKFQVNRFSRLRVHHLCKQHFGKNAFKVFGLDCIELFNSYKYAHISENIYRFNFEEYSQTLTYTFNIQ